MRSSYTARKHPSGGAQHRCEIGGSRHVGETGLIVRVGKSEEGAEQIDQLYVETATWPP